MITVSASHLRRYSLHQQHKLIPTHWTKANALAVENFRVKPSLFQTLMVHRISATLPMQYFHDLAAPAHENIRIAIRRVKTNRTHPATHSIHTHTHIVWMLSHHKPIILIQVEHRFFAQRSASC